ncbi:MAG: hypothetical protein H6531_00730 [Actinobacteria bacterium]|nr:hypothetical protein [Actinomycetota bacterium]
MTHDEMYERLPALLGPHTPDADELEVRSHVETCERCRRRLASLERVVGMLADARDDEPLEPGDELRARVLAIPDAHPPRGAYRRRWFAPGTAVAAAAAVIAALVLVWPGGSTHSTHPDFVAAKTMRLEPERQSSVRGTIALAAPSGSTQMVRLDVSGLPVDGSATFDLWMMSDAGAIHVGSFGPEDDGSCVVEMMALANEPMDAMVITRAGAGPAKPLASVHLHT